MFLTSWQGRKIFDAVMKIAFCRNVFAGQIFRASILATTHFSFDTTWADIFKLSGFMGSSWSTAVEYTPQNREVVGSNPAKCWAFLCFFLFYLPSGRCFSTNYVIAIQSYLAVLLKAKQAHYAPMLTAFLNLASYIWVKFSFFTHSYASLNQLVPQAAQLMLILRHWTH